MKKYSVFIESRAFMEIQNAISYYNSLSNGLGEKFFADLDKQIEKLKISPFFQVRYKDIRCLPLKKFPFMIHFTVNEIQITVYIHAVINCYQNPETAWLV